MLGLTAPNITPPGELNSKAIDVTIPGSGSGNVDVILYSTLCAVDYQLCVYNPTEDVWTSFRLYGSKKSGGTVEDTLYSVIGDNFDFDVEFLVVTTNAVLRITNNETYPLTVEGIRIR